MRGKRRLHRSTHTRVRLIPAHAGKTTPRGRLRTNARAHPRACGENRAALMVTVPSRGSSPRMRGKQSSKPAMPFRAGLIPAHAGKTWTHTTLRPGGRAHPRACGENHRRRPLSRLGLGSSPRMRGKPRAGALARWGVGLIPAHAGKTLARASRWRRARAHPRACGENCLCFEDHLGRVGSSPRMRGKPVAWFQDLIQGGLIPAHAGKTCSARPRASQSWAHPRACGENSRTACESAGLLGSSPRMRGKRPRGRVCAYRGGLIPAHAGKTTWSLSCISSSPAHPRACGENAERSGVLALRSVRSWKTFSFPSSLKVTHCRAFVQLPFSRIRL